VKKEKREFAAEEEKEKKRGCAVEERSFELIKALLFKNGNAFGPLFIIQSLSFFDIKQI